MLPDQAFCTTTPALTTNGAAMAGYEIGGGAKAANLAAPKNKAVRMVMVSPLKRNAKP